MNVMMMNDVSNRILIPCLFSAAIAIAIDTDGDGCLLPPATRHIIANEAG
jgi:hypothetical protein